MSSRHQDAKPVPDLIAATPLLDQAPVLHPLQRLAAQTGLSQAALQRKILQRRAQRDGDAPADAQTIATQGLAGDVQALPHLAPIQAAFGHHDVTGIQAHVGGPAAPAAEALGASAYATGNSVAFAQGPDLHTAAHEAAHIVQQRAGVQLAGGLGQEGDSYEQHADRVADAVVSGRSAEALLDQHAGGPGPSAGGATQRHLAEGEAIQAKFSQTIVAVQDNHHGGVKSQYTSGTNTVELHIESGANQGGKMLQDFLLALWEARDTLAEGEKRGVAGVLFMRPGGAQVLKMTMEMLGEALGSGDQLEQARHLKEVRQQNKVPLTGDNDTIDPTITPEHKGYRDALVGVQGVTMAPIGGGTSGGTVNMLTDDDQGAAERTLYDQAIFTLKPMLGLSVTVDLATVNKIIEMMEDKMTFFQKLALKAQYKMKG